jgi:hypothetical protein
MVSTGDSIGSHVSCKRQHSRETFLKSSLDPLKECGRSPASPAKCGLLSSNHSGLVELAMKLESLKETKREDRQGQAYPCSTRADSEGRADLQENYWKKIRPQAILQSIDQRDWERWRFESSGFGRKVRMAWEKQLMTAAVVNKF